MLEFKQQEGMHVGKKTNKDDDPLLEISSLKKPKIKVKGNKADECKNGPFGKDYEIDEIDTILFIKGKRKGVRKRRNSGGCYWVCVGGKYYMVCN